jgi:hypothetical protein
MSLVRPTTVGRVMYSEKRRKLGASDIYIKTERAGRRRLWTSLVVVDWVDDDGGLPKRFLAHPAAPKF